MVRHALIYGGPNETQRGRCNSNCNANSPDGAKHVINQSGIQLAFAQGLAGQDYRPLGNQGATVTPSNCPNWLSDRRSYQAS